VTSIDLNAPTGRWLEKARAPKVAAAGALAGNAEQDAVASNSTRFTGSPAFLTSWRLRLALGRAISAALGLGHDRFLSGRFFP
jgi:hypothetical protein